MEEIRHHNARTISVLVSRAERELDNELFQAFERTRRHVLSLGLTPDSVYSVLNRALIFLKHVQATGKGLDELDLDDVNAFLAPIGSPGTKNVYVRAIRALGKANAHKHPAFYRLTMQVKYPRRKVKIPVLPSPKEVELLIQNAHQPYKALIAVLYEGGLRRCEALNLRYGDVKDWDVGYKVMVRFTKSVPRAVFIIRYAYILREWLESHRSKRPEDWLFYGRRGTPIKPSALTTYFRRLCRRLGLNPDILHPHNLRHLRATELYKSRKLTELEMMKLFGWRTRHMIDVYSKITMDDVEERFREIYGIKRRDEGSQIFCPKCGLRIEFTAHFCPRCGIKLDEEAVRKEALREEERFKRLLRLLERKVRGNPELVAKLLDLVGEKQ